MLIVLVIEKVWSIISLNCFTTRIPDRISGKLYWRTIKGPFRRY